MEISFLIPASATLLSLTVIFIFVAFTLNYPLVKSQLLGNDRKAKQRSLPPGPKPNWPIVGNLPELMKSKKKTSVPQWIHKFMKERNTNIACIRIGNVHVIPVTCPEIGHEFLRRQDSIFASRPLTMSSDVLTRGYLATALVPLGNQWKKMRRVMAGEVLSPARHRWLHAKRVEEADHLVRYVHNQCSNNADEGGLVNLRVVARQYCGNAIRKLVFNRRYFGEGKEDGGPGYEEEEHIEAIFTILAHIFSFCISDYIPWLRGLDLEGHEKIMDEATRVLGKYHDPIIDERIQQWREGRKEGVEDLLDVLVSLKDDNGDSLLSAEEIKAQINVSLSYLARGLHGNSTNQSFHITLE